MSVLRHEHPFCGATSAVHGPRSTDAQLREQALHFDRAAHCNTSHVSLYVPTPLMRCEMVRRVHVQLAWQLRAPVVPQHHSGSAQRTSSRQQPICAVGALPALNDCDDVGQDLA